MGKKQDIDAENILEAAKILLKERGAKDTTLNDIARESGITKPGLYRCFDSKDDIIHSLIDTEIKTLKKSLEKGMNMQENPIFNFALIWENAISFYEKDDFLMHLLSGNELDLPPYMYDHYNMEIEDYVVDLLQGLVQQAIDSDEFKECDSRIAAYMGYKIYQAGTYSRTSTLKDFSPRQIMEKTMLIMGWGIMNLKGKDNLPE